MFPFTKFREFDPILGPEMRSTGEVMGIADSFGSAFAKAQLAADNALPLERGDLHHGERLRQADGDADRAAASTRWASRCTRRRERRATSAGAASRRKTVLKVHEGRPNGIDLIVNGEVQLLINTPLGKHAQRDDYTLRQAAIAQSRLVHDDAVGGERRVRRHPGAALAHAVGAVAAGVARGSAHARGGDATGMTPT